MFTETEKAAVGHFYALRLPQDGSILRAQYQDHKVEAGTATASDDL
jgi:hypothetical protein